MKRLVHYPVAILLVSIFMLVPGDLSAQKHKQKNKKGGPPAWAPAHGYRAKQAARHIYYPEHNIYYDRHKEVYIYVEMGKWSVGAHLPLPLRNRITSDVMYVDLAERHDHPQSSNDEHLRRYRRFSKS